jgi:hypothetical protein
MYSWYLNWKITTSILLNSGLVGVPDDIINWANFGFDRFRGIRSARPFSTTSPAYNKRSAVGNRIYKLWWAKIKSMLLSLTVLMLYTSFYCMHTHVTVEICLLQIDTLDVVVDRVSIKSPHRLVQLHQQCRNNWSEESQCRASQVCSQRFNGVREAAGIRKLHAYSRAIACICWVELQRDLSIFTCRVWII